MSKVDLIQLDQLISAWVSNASALHGDSVGLSLSRQLKNPSIFDGIEKGTYTGIHRGSQRMSCLLDLVAVSCLMANVTKLAPSSAAEKEDQQSQQRFLDDLFGEAEEEFTTSSKGDQSQSTSAIDWSDGKFLSLLKPIKQEDYDEVRPVNLEERQAARAVFQSIMRHNKNAKKSKARAGRASEAKRQLSLARELAVVKTSNIVVISVDLEWHEQDNSVLLELGWSIYEGQGSDGKDRISHHHWIVAENLGKANGRFVPDNRRSFLFGESIVGELESGVARLKADCSASMWRDRYGPGEEIQVALVGHGMSQDLQVMNSLGIDIEKGVEVIDTNNLVSALYGASTQISLRALLSLLEVEDVKKLHNAGNDAAFTLTAFLRLARRS